jgi:hypothetical protein
MYQVGIFERRYATVHGDKTREYSISFYLGGKVPSEPKEWMPDMKAVRATIKYAMATGRSERDDGQALDRSQYRSLTKTNTTQP